MNCQECSTTNKDDAKFCSNCGAELHGAESHHTLKRCFHCGFENAREARFCANCGIEMKRPHHQPTQKHHQEQKPPKEREKRVDTRLKWNPALAVLLIIGGVTIFLALPFITDKPPGRKPQPLVEQRSSNPTIEARVMEIASKFICSCGTCGEQPLDVCTCERAVEERQFIRNYLQAGQTNEQIIAVLNTTFGWIKPEFASLVGSTNPKAGISTKLDVPKQSENNILSLASKISGNAKLATTADRIEIFSRFKCPCGQCGIDELKDCNCNHPRGAQEVKAFVDERIREAKYTVAQLISDVERKYGSRKF